MHLTRGEGCWRDRGEQRGEQAGASQPWLPGQATLRVRAARRSRASARRMRARRARSPAAAAPAVTRVQSAVSARTREQGHRTSLQREHRAFDQQLREDAPAHRTQRHPNSDGSLPQARAREQQVHDVEAGEGHYQSRNDERGRAQSRHAVEPLLKCEPPPLTRQRSQESHRAHASATTGRFPAGEARGATRATPHRAAVARPSSRPILR